MIVPKDSPVVIADITDTAEPADVRDAFDVPDDEEARRQGWIVEQLVAGVRHKALTLVAHFKQTKKTALGNLDAL